MTQPIDGLLVVDKPVGPTSHDVVARMRRVLAEKRVGHTGTLDPAASGVLALVVGRATRLAQFLSASDKEYDAVVRLGFATTTYDAQGDPIEPRWVGPMPSGDAVEQALDAFVGAFDQHPPAYSAKKIAGVRSYTLARAAERASADQVRAAGQPSSAPGARTPAPASVTLYRAEVVAVEADLVTIRLRCSTGFYVRSLAHDLGARLGIGAHLAALRRTRSGDHGLDAALTLDAAERDPAAARAAVIPLERLLPSWPAVVLTDAGAKRAGNGSDLGAADVQEPVPAGPHVRLLDTAGRLVGIGEPSAAPGLLHPAVVFM